MILTGDKSSIRRKTCPTAASFFTNPMWIGLRQKPGIRGERPETKLSELFLYRELFLCYSWYQTLRSEFYVLLTLHPSTILQINPTRCTILLSIFISLLYTFQANMCPLSGEITVSMRYWYLSLCMGGVWSAGWSETPTSRPDATRTQ